MKLVRLFVIFMGIAFVFATGKAVYDVQANMSELNELDVRINVEGVDGDVSRGEAIPAGYFVLAVVLAPLKFFILGKLVGYFAKKEVKA